MPEGKIQQVAEQLGALMESVELPDISPVRIEPSHGGYVMLNVERTSGIMALHDAILELAASAREGVDTDKYGSKYVRDSFVPHVSLAKVDRDDLNSATNIGRRAFGSCLATRTRTLDLCDIGPRSERWDVLASYPNGESPRL